MATAGQGRGGDGLLVLSCVAVTVFRLPSERLQRVLFISMIFSAFGIGARTRCSPSCAGRRVEPEWCLRRREEAGKSDRWVGRSPKLPEPQTHKKKITKK